MHWLIGFSMLSVVSSLPTTSNIPTVIDIVNDQKTHDIVADFDFNKYKHNLTHERLYYDNLAKKCDNVFIVSGGTTAANTGEQYPYNITDNVLMWNYSLPGWQPATTQLAGSDGNAYSPWAGVGFNISNITNGSVCLIGTARQNSCVNEWCSYNSKYHYLLDKAHQIASKYGNNYGTPIFLWSQGECDVKYKTLNYDVLLTNVLTSFSNNTWLISQTSYSPWTYYQNEETIRYYQNKVVHEIATVYAGPNTDALCVDDRFTDNTFNLNGQHKLINGWTISILRQQDSFIFGDYLCPFKEFYLSDLLFAALYIIGFILMGTACCVGSYYIIWNNNRGINKVYYYLVPNNSEKISLLHTGSVNSF